jgi:hypothetical protein
MHNVQRYVGMSHFNALQHNGRPTEYNYQNIPIFRPFLGGGLVCLHKAFFFFIKANACKERMCRDLWSVKKNAWFCLTCSKCRPTYVVFVLYPLHRSLYMNTMFLKWSYLCNTSTMSRLTIRGAMQPFLHTPSWRGALLSTETTLIFNYSYNILAQIFNDLSKILMMFINSCSCHNCEWKCYIYIYPISKPHILSPIL